ncbi:hypothetical protein B0H19DRAFT_1197165 [Mycena capillaripes]|nr:hypothetical protein B0H19DRAFT_1197165 [Mycena capillaripes]
MIYQCDRQPLSSLTMPRHSHIMSLIRRLRHALSVPSETVQAALPLHPHLSSGFDRSLFFLLVNGVVSVAWGVTLAVFASGHIPISWIVSQYGQRHTGLTNVIVTGIATLATAHLKYTIRRATEEYTTMRLAEGLSLPTWSWLQGVAAVDIWPPLQREEQMWAWIAWLLLFGSMAGHSASVVAILQPQSYFDYVPSNDPTPCGVDPVTLTMNSNLTAQTLMDQDAFMFGLQLGNYGDQVRGNTTTAVSGRIYVKDKFGYGAFSDLANARQDVAGIEINARCDSSHDAMSLPLRWSSAFPGLPLTTLNINDAGAFVASVASDGSHAVIKSSFNSTYTPFHSTSISFNWTSMYAAVNASGSGVMFIADNSGLSTSCTWVATPRHVHVEIRDFIAFAASTDDAPTAPAPVGRAIYSTVRGIMQAIRLGAILDVISTGATDFPAVAFDKTGKSRTGAANILQSLLADGLKAALTAQYTEDCWADVQRCDAVGISICDSNNRAVEEHWRFGDENNLGVLAILLTLGFGLYALWVIWTVRKRPRVKGMDTFKVVDAFKMGLDKIQNETDGDGFWAVHNGRVGVQGEDWSVVEEPESESVPLVPLGSNSEGPLEAPRRHS